MQSHPKDLDTGDPWNVHQCHRIQYIICGLYHQHHHQSGHSLDSAADGLGATDFPKAQVKGFFGLRGWYSVRMIHLMMHRQQQHQIKTYIPAQSLCGN